MGTLNVICLQVDPAPFAHIMYTGFEYSTSLKADGYNEKTCVQQLSIRCPPCHNTFKDVGHENCEVGWEDLLGTQPEVDYGQW